MNHSPRIMVVDDEPNVRLMLRTTLESGGYEIVEAEDGKVALDRLRSTPVNLIVLDLNMPQMGGMETLQQLREHGNNTPVVILTAYGTIPDAVAAVKLGAIDFLSKPLTPEALRKVVADVVERHSEGETAPRSEVSQEHLPEVRFAQDLTRAKRALNRLEFDEAELFLDQAMRLNPTSKEAKRLLELLQEGRRAHEGPYRLLRKML